MREEFVFTLNPEFVQELQSANRHLQGIEDTYQDINEISKETFSKATASTKDFGNETAKTARRVDQVDRQIDELTKTLKTLKQAQKNSFDRNEIRKYSKEIANTEKALAKLRTTQKRSMEGLNKSTSLGISLFKKLGPAVAGAFAGFSILEQVKNATKLAQEYEQLQVSFTTFLGSAEKANQVLSNLSKFSTATPFEPDQVYQAGRALLAFGVSAKDLVPTLRSIGDISAATKKDFNELAVIYGKARTAGVLYAEDINQLVEAGIPIIEEFAKQLGIGTSEVKKMASQGRIGFKDLEKAFKNMTGEGGRFFNMMEAQSKTALGLASTRAGMVAEAMKAIGDIFLPLTKRFNEFIINLSQGFLKLTNRAKYTTIEFDKQRDGVQRLESVLPPLLSRYEELTRKTNLSAGEQEELKKIIAQVAEIAPTAVTKIDEYGRALGISAEKAREFVEAEQARLEFVNQKAIKATQRQVDILKARQAKLQKISETGKDYNLVGVLVDIDGDRLKRARDKLNETTKQIVGAEQELKRLRGDLIETSEEIIEKEEEVVNVRKASYKDLQKLASQGNIEASNELARRREYAKQAQQIEQRTQQLKLEGMKEGIAKEIAIEENRFETLKSELEKYKLDTTQAEQQHYINLAAIKEKYKAIERAKNDEIFKKELEQEVFFNQLIEDERERAIANESTRFAAFEQELRVAGATLDQIRAAYNLHRAKIKEINDKYDQVVLKDKVEQAKAEIELEEAKFQETILLLQKEFDARQHSEEEIAQFESNLGRTKEIFDLEIQKKRLQNELKFNEDMSEIEQAGIEQRIKNIDTQIDSLKTTTTGDTKKDFSIWSVFGLDPESDRDLIEGIETAANEIVGVIDMINQARLEAANIALQSADRQVDAAERALETELQLAEKGFANSVDLKKRELDEAKKLQAKALEDQRKAQRQQIILDAAIQASSLITSSANIFKTVSGLGPFGIPLAIGLIAAMFAAFIKAKADAIKATKVQAKKGLGGKVGSDGVVVGRSHASGGVPLEVESGEFFSSDGKRFGVVNKKMTAKHYDLLQAINKDDRRAMAMNLLDLTGGVTLDRDIADSIRRNIVNNVNVDVDMKPMKENNRLLREYLKKSSQKRDVTIEYLSDGTKIEKSKNRIRVIR